MHMLLLIVHLCPENHSQGGLGWRGDLRNRVIHTTCPKLCQSSWCSRIPPSIMYLLRTPPAKEPFSFPGFRKEGFLHHQPFWVVLAVSACWMVTVLPSSLHGGLVYWGTKAFVANADSRARMWTADFTLVLGVFSKDFVPLPSNRGQWLANWTELGKAEFDADEARFAGVVDLSSGIPSHANPQAYLWARNGLDLTKGPEWLLMTRPDWQWPTSSPPHSPALTWITSSSESIVLGAVDLNGYHLLTSRATPIPIPQQEWLKSHFPTTQAAIDPEADPDGDGMSNRLEYYLGSNPNSGSSTVAPEILTANDQAVVKLKRNPFADTEWIMESSSDMVTWVTSSPQVMQDRPDYLEMKVLRDPSEKAAFFRFNFKSPPP